MFYNLNCVRLYNTFKKQTNACIYVHLRCIYVWLALWGYACAHRRETAPFTCGFAFVPQTTSDIGLSHVRLYLEDVGGSVTIIDAMEKHYVVAFVTYG